MSEASTTFGRTPFHQNPFILFLDIAFRAGKVSTIQIIVAVGHRNGRVAFVRIHATEGRLLLLLRRQEHAFGGGSGTKGSSRAGGQSLTSICHGPGTIQRRLGLMRPTRRRVGQIERAIGRIDGRVTPGMVDTANRCGRRSSGDVRSIRGIALNA